MSKPEYARSDDGRVHMVSPVMAEYTLCGNAYEGYEPTNTFFSPGEAEPDPKRWQSCKKGPVTCEECALIIVECRKVRVSLPA